MNKADLAARIADKLGTSKKMAEDFVACFEETVTETLVKSEEVTIAGFGTFSARLRAGRMGVNPQNPTQKIQIPAVTVPKFKAGKALKDALKGKRKVGASAPIPPRPEPAAAPTPITPTAPTESLENTSSNSAL